MKTKTVTKKPARVRMPKKGDLVKDVPDIRDLDALVLAGEEKLTHIGKGSHIEDWLVVGAGLNVGRELALKAGSSSSKPYRAEMTAWLEAHPLYGEEHIDKDTRMALLNLYGTPGALDALKGALEAMTPGQRARTSTPRAAWDKIKTQYGFKDPKAAKRQREASTAIEVQGMVGELQDKLAKSIPLTLSDDETREHIAEAWRNPDYRAKLRFIEFVIHELAEAEAELVKELPPKKRRSRRQDAAQLAH